MCNLYRVSETDNAPPVSEMLLVCVAGRKTIVGGFQSHLRLARVVWVGLGVLVLFENSIVCQCTFVAWVVCLPCVHCVLHPLCLFGCVPVVVWLNPLMDHAAVWFGVRGLVDFLAFFADPRFFPVGWGLVVEPL